MRLRAGLLAALAALAAAGSAYAAPKSLPALTPSAPDGLTRALAVGEIGEGRYALERAASLFDRRAVAAAFGPVAPSGGRDATMVLLDLFLRLPTLAPDERDRAEALLARPDDRGAGDGERTYTVAPASPVCTEHFCIHYVTSTDDAPELADADGNGIPDAVDASAQVLEAVWAKEVVEYGFRPPKPDDTSANHGPDARLDVYLSDVGSDSLYGYCASDDPARGERPRGPWDYSAYCVLDNDFSPSQFVGGASGRPALEVTAAHEFFHAIQFAYDIEEDRWFMEATATWMEDQVYDDVNDNYQYLESSQLTEPRVPLDLTSFEDPLSGFQYGGFVFFRSLTEWLENPLLIRRIWEFADGSRGALDQYSLQAANSALREQGTTLRAAFARFGAINVAPSSFYEEGSAYPVPRPSRSVALGRLRAPTRGTVALDHLTTWYARFRPGPETGADSRLRLTLDLPPVARGSEASVVVVDAAGKPTIRPIVLSKAGDGAVTVGFDPARVRSVHLVLSNASRRFDCWQGNQFSCQGNALDDGLEFRYQARVVRAATR